MASIKTGELEVTYVSKEYLKNRPIKDPTDPAQLFTDIKRIVLLLSAECNFYNPPYTLQCRHCCVNYNNHKNSEGVFPILSGRMAFSILELISTNNIPIIQFTNSGGEPLLFDPDVWKYALSHGLLDPGIGERTEGCGYLPELIKEESRILTSSIPKLQRLYVLNEKPLLRIPTNGILLPWLEGIDLNDEVAVINSGLYDLLNRHYREASLNLSIGHYLLAKYLGIAKRLMREGNSLGDHISLERRIDELIAVQGLMENPFELNFLLTHPTNMDPDSYPLAREIYMKYPFHKVESSRVVRWGAGSTLRNAAVPWRLGAKKPLSGIDELYLIPVLESNGDEIAVYESTFFMYDNTKEKQLFRLALR